MQIDLPSLAEQIAWENASEFGKLAGDPVPVYCEVVNDYHDRHIDEQDADKKEVMLDLCAELADWRTKTLAEAGYWDGRGDLTDDTENFGNGIELPLIPDFDYDGDFDD